MLILVQEEFTYVQRILFAQSIQSNPVVNLVIHKEDKNIKIKAMFLVYKYKVN